MLTNIGEAIALIISVVACIISFILIIKKVEKSQLRKSWLIVNTCMIIMCLGMISQIFLSKPLNISPIYFEYITYLGNAFLSVGLFFTALIYANTKITFKKRYFLLFIIPVASLLILWTNDYHHLFYEKYSIYPSQTVYGSFLPIYNAYSIGMMVISIIYLLRCSIKNSGFFSMQSILITLAFIIPIGMNILSSFKVLNTTIYITPISFSLTIILLTFSIFKFDFLKLVPIALQRIVNRISDGYLVLDTENNITDFNKTFLQIANAPANKLRGKNMFSLVVKDTYFNIDAALLKEYIEKSKSTGKIYSFEIKLSNVEKYFNVEVSSIFSESSFLGILMLFKDITQHTLDLRTIKESQDMLMEKERLASLGQLVGGIAHNLKTPIMSIAGATEGLKDLIKEYDISIGDPEVNENDHHEIARDMYNWVDKIKDYTKYMSDVITAVKGQTVTLVNDESVSFTVSEMLNRVNILMKHELKNAIVYLDISVKTDENLSLNGDVNSLVQVINNMISNSIQAYDGKKDQKIDLIVERINNNLVITVKDYGPGIPKNILKKLFKEMVTTKGKNGTGLGLFMSYSTIRGHFNGNITVESKKNEGTTFKIILPLFYN